MQSVRSVGRGSNGRARAVTIIASVGALATLAACTTSSHSNAGKQAGAPAKSGASTTAAADHSSSAADPAVITISGVGKRITPNTPVSVSIAHGKITTVKMTNAAKKVVTGAMAADGASWRVTEDLGYGKTYDVAVTGKNDDGSAVTKHAQVKTVDPDNKVDVALDRTGEYPLSKGATYGVAILPEFVFDEAISSPADKLAAQKAITITTTPHVAGAFAWNDDQHLYYRPQAYWPAGTKVSVDAKLYGVHLGKGLYGQQDKSTSFTVGRKQTTIADDNAPQSVNTVKVYNAAGKVIKTMHTSMGEHSGTTVNGQYINFYTLDGTYTVLTHENPANMSSDSYGLPANAPGGYKSEKIYWSTKISVDGIYLHELDSTVYAQEHGADVSHGCLNLSKAHAQWYYKHSMVGDPVVINGKKAAPKIQVWQGGGWSVPWSAWQTGNISKY